jgi:hypothetical protein
MQTIFRTNVILTVGLLALPFTTQIGLAQSCAPGLGMSVSDLLFGKQRPAPADFSSATGFSFVSPGAIVASSVNHAWMIDSGDPGIGVLALTYSPTTSSLSGTPVSLANVLETPVAIAWDGTYLWGVDQYGNFGTSASPETGPRPGMLSAAHRPITNMIADGVYLWISDSEGSLFRVLTSTTAAPVIAHVMLPGPINPIAGLTFDGRYVWAVTSGTNNGPVLSKVDTATLAVTNGSSVSDLNVPRSLAFDGYSIWVAALNYVARINAATGARTGTYTASDARELSFDGNQMWVANRASNSLTPVRACDGSSVLQPYTTPTYPENVAFDGKNLWVTSPTSKTVSIR